MISKLVLCFASVVLSFLAASSQTQPGAERKILVRNNSAVSGDRPQACLSPR
jgi:hypothetical protein